MFESTGWLLEEPEVNDSSKFDMIFPTVVKPPSSSIALQSADDIEVSRN
jgi:cation-transporting ATPase 13A3/4/5